MLRSVLAERLPSTHFALLGRLMGLLALTVSLEDNKMTVAGLAAVWGPNLLRPRVESAAQLTDVVNVVSLVAIMIQHADALFGNPVPLGKTAAAADD